MSGFKVDVQRVSSSCFPRFLLTDRSGRYWTGINWTREPTKAVLFARKADAQNFCSSFQDAPVQESFSSVVVRIDARLVCTSEDLRDYLKRNLRLTLGDDGGEHPCDGSCIEVVIDFDGLQDIK